MLPTVGDNVAQRHVDVTDRVLAGSTPAIDDQSRICSAHNGNLNDEHRVRRPIRSILKAIRVASAIPSVGEQLAGRVSRDGRLADADAFEARVNDGEVQCGDSELEAVVDFGCRRSVECFEAVEMWFGGRRASHNWGLSHNVL